MSSTGDIFLLMLRTLSSFVSTPTTSKPDSARGCHASTSLRSPPAVADDDLDGLQPRVPAGQDFPDPGSGHSSRAASSETRRPDEEDLAAAGRAEKDFGAGELLTKLALVKGAQ